MIRVLLIEDNPADARLVEYYLQEAFGGDFSLVGAIRLSQGLTMLSGSKFDIVISDITLPDSKGLETFSSVAVAASGMPIIVLTGSRDESLGLEAVRKGAADFLNKSQLDSAILKRAIIYSLERHKLQKELIAYAKKIEAKEKQLEEAQRMAHIGNWEWDVATNTLNWSDELYKIHGMTPQRTTMSFDKSEEWIVPGDMLVIKSQMKNNFEEAKKAFEKDGIKEYTTPSMNYRIVLPDGQERTLLGQGKLILNEQGKPVQMVGTVQDITLLKAAEMKLRETNAGLEKRVSERTRDMELTIKQLQDEIEKREKSEREIKNLYFLIGKTDNAIVIAEKSGDIRWVNDGFIRLTGYALAEVQGTYGEILRRGEKTGLNPNNPLFNKLLKEKQSVTYESCNCKKDGTEYWSVSTLTPILNEEGEVESVVAVDSDITTRKKAEQDILNAKKLAEESSRAKELFLTNMSHEIRTPMNAIMGIVQLMQDMELDETQKKYLHSLQFAGESLLYIINDILDLAKIESGKMNIEKIGFNLTELIEELATAMQYKAKEKNISLLAEVPKDISGELVGDPVRLNQILTNLLGNAIKFTEKGHVKLIVKETKKADQKITLRFAVEDTGIGIEKEKQEIIFAAFEQAQKETSRKYGGTGLGLSIVKKLLELQGSTISIASELGKGSEFSFELTFPVSKNIGKDPDKKKRPVLAIPDLTGKKILLVEDNALNQMVAEKFLEGMGLKISIASNGVEAVDMLKKNSYDIILMDIQMPEMDGYEATRYIRNNLNENIKNTPILAMTAHAFRDEEKKCKNAGMNDYISKPLNRNILQDKVIQLLNSPKT